MNDSQNITRGRLAHLRIDERNHVEKPLLDQLDGLKWEIIDLDSKQHPGDNFRETLTKVVMLRVLWVQLGFIPRWPANNHTELEACGWRGRS